MSLSLIMDFPDAKDWIETLVDAEILLERSYDLLEIFNNDFILPDFSYDRSLGVKLMNELTRQTEQLMRQLKNEGFYEVIIVGVGIDDEIDAVCLDIRINL